MSSENANPSRKDVSTELGHTQFARTPRRPYSTARDFVSITTPPLDAQYAALYGTARTPATEATFTMLPRDSSSSGRARWHIRNVPVRFTDSVRFHSSSDTSA